MYTFLLSVGIVALAEIGDKTQLLSFVLAARYRKPIPIIVGILIATLLNHGAASALGAWIAQALGETSLRWILGLSFIAMAGWMLIPDSLDEAALRPPKWGIFITTLVVFFLAEMGDKTQIATVALAARFNAFWTVLLGTTVGMLIANVPAVLVGERLANRLPVRAIHRVAAGVFLILGVAVLFFKQS
jgi:Ca2+/H+ antiporter, TMEM165/GDT1 family